jgi:para-nitrobenzyl esterase
MSRETAAERAGKMLKLLGFDKSQIADLQKLSWEQILDAQVAVAGTGLANGFAPVVDGTIIPRHPFDPTAPDVSANVPMIVSTALDEAALLLTNFNLDEAGLHALAKNLLGSNADRVLSLYRKAYPDASPYLIQARIMTDRGFRAEAYKQAERKAECSLQDGRFRRSAVRHSCHQH